MAADRATQNDGMSTIVFLHAHPDDESSLTAGSMAMAAARGHRVVVVYATGGEHGSRPADLDEAISTAEYRRTEAEASARVTGTARVAWLGYRDSGMTGWQQNGETGSLTGADPQEAARRLAVILDEEDADVLVGYDHHGNYGHPDHLVVHDLGNRAVELAARRPRLLEATRSTEAMSELRDHPDVEVMVTRLGLQTPVADDVWNSMMRGDDGLPMGVSEAQIAWQVDLDDDVVALKREAMACHSSQTDDIGMMLSLPPGMFRAMFGREYFVEPGVPGPMRHAWPF